MPWFKCKIVMNKLHIRRLYFILCNRHTEAGKLKLYGKLWRGKYPDEYRYLYETNPDQAYFESIGFNTLHLSSFPLVVSALFPGYTPAQLDRIFDFYQEGRPLNTLFGLCKAIQ